MSRVSLLVPPLRTFFKVFLGVSGAFRGFSASTFTWDAAGGGRLHCGLGCISFSLCPEVGGAGKPPTLGLRGDAVEGEGSPGGFGGAGRGSVLRVRPRPCRLLRSVKLFPSPPSNPTAHGGCKKVGAGGGATGVFFKIRRIWNNLQLAAPCRAGSKGGGGGHAWARCGGTP